MRISDWSSDVCSSDLLTGSNKPHDIAFVLQPVASRFHHVSFLLESVNDLFHAGDLIGKYEIPVDISPNRHGVTRGATIYFFDPSGNRNEEIGRASVRERVFKYGLIQGVAGALKQK